MRRTDDLRGAGQNAIEDFVEIERAVQGRGGFTQGFGDVRLAALSLKTACIFNGDGAWCARACKRSACSRVKKLPSTLRSVTNPMI